MTNFTAISRRFKVHARHIDRHHARIVHEASFEAAAIAYSEDFPAAADADPMIGIVVCDIDSGHEHCFRIDLAEG